MKTNNPLFSALGIIVAFLVVLMPYFHSSLILQLLCGVIAGILVFASVYKKLDFDDSMLYALIFLGIGFAFGFNDFANYASQGINLFIYIAAYLIGSIPFGLLLAQKFAHINIKEQGSKSIGATNVLRVVKEQDKTLAKKLAIATIVLDFGKAFVPLCVMKILGFDEAMLYSVGVFMVLGHCFSLYLHLEGGKGIATGAGVMALLLPLELLCALVVWFVVGKVFKISSLASLCAALSFIIASFIIHADMAINSHAPIFVICFIIFYKHIPNIKRLLSKEECKVI